MPQMAPLLWLPLYTALASMIYLNNTLLYFNKPRLSPAHTKPPVNLLTTTWKW